MRGDCFIADYIMSGWRARGWVVVVVVGEAVDEEQGWWSLASADDTTQPHDVELWRENAALPSLLRPVRHRRPGAYTRSHFRSI